MYSNIDIHSSDLLPDNDPQRILLHNEVHARPSQRIRLPALVIYVVVINDGITREQECEHLRRLPGQETLVLEQLQNNFLRLRLQGYTLRWERHSEFTRYSLVQNLPEVAQLGATDPELLSYLTLPPGWLAEIPGRTFAAIKLAMVHGDLNESDELLMQARQWFGGNAVVASRIVRYEHSLAVTDFMLHPSGFELMLVIMPLNAS